MRNRAHDNAADVHLPPTLSEIVVSSPAVLHGMPVFVETVVPVEALLEYRRGGAPLYEFLLDFPTVRRAHARRVWAWMDKLSVAETRKALAQVKAHSAATQAHSPKHPNK